MKTFVNLSPQFLPSDDTIVLEYSESEDMNSDKNFYYLLIDEDYAIWAYRSLMRAYEINGRKIPEKWVGR